MLHSYSIEKNNVTENRSYYNLISIIFCPLFVCFGSPRVDPDRTQLPSGLKVNKKTNPGVCSIPRKKNLRKISVI